jgi:predicted transposase YbfD/YdcC
MPRITINEFEITDTDFVSVQEFFQALPDPRSSINRKHLLSDVAIICLCGVLAGAEGPISIGLWAESQADWLLSVLPLPNGVPAHDTIGRVLAALKPSVFQNCFVEWVAELRARPPAINSALKSAEYMSANSPAREQREQVAIDGKTLRRSHDRGKGLNPLQLVSAWSVTNGLSLGQVETADKSNEITAIPVLLSQLELRDTIITIDAAGCQTAIAAAIRAGGADYVLSLKGNQEKIHDAVMKHVMEVIDQPATPTAYQMFNEKSKAHGRVDEWTYYQMPAPETLPRFAEWAGLKTIGVAIRQSKRGDQECDECRYFLSSLPLDAQEFARCVRGHWAIENTLHWTLDMTFREDESRVRNRHAANNLAWLKRFSLSLLKRQTDKESIKMRRSKAGWNVDYLTQVLGLKRT